MAVIAGSGTGLKSETSSSSALLLLKKLTIEGQKTQLISLGQSCYHSTEGSCLSCSHSRNYDRRGPKLSRYRRFSHATVLALD